MWQIERHGRLIIGRIVSFADDDDVRRYCDEWRRRANEIAGKFLVCADYRRVSVFSPHAAEALKELMAGLGGRVERSAMVIDPSHATHNMQVQRLARETGHEARRRFSDVGDAIAWLGEVTTADERRAASEFLLR